MIKANGEFLDFDGDIETEQQIKLFEEISTSNGDFSYSFDLPKTSKNLKALGLPFPDTIKSIYRNVPCELIDDSGFKINSGGLQVGKITDVIPCSFFGGNNDWFGLLNNPMTALPLQRYDVDLTVANIQTSWTKNSGLVFPILDAGALVSRSFSNLKVEDFTACFYVKTLFKEIFNPLGIKIEGDLLKDELYNILTIASNGKSQDDVDRRTSYVNKTTPQTLLSALTKITFQDETTFPFGDGAQGNFAASTYTADVKMRVKLNLTLKSLLLGGAVSTAYIYVYVGGVQYSRYSISAGVGGGIVDFTKELEIPLEGFQTLEIYENVNGAATFSAISGSIKVTPVYIYRAFGNSSVPNWTQGEFVSNIMRVFNVLPSFNANSKTLTLNLFNKIAEKTPIDVSDNVTITETDFTEFVSNYGKLNYFKYQEGDDEDLRKYNISNLVKYGDGVISIDNDFIQPDSDAVESDFSAPITYLNGVFDTSMERIHFVELDEIEEKTITSVSDASGVPRFNISNADNLFVVGDLVRIDTGADSDFEYNGEFVIKTVTSTYIEVNGLSFGTSADGSATLLRHKFTDDNNVYLFANVSNVNTLFFSSLASMLIDSTSFSSASLAYFNLLSNGREINLKYKQSLAFGEVNSPLNYQQTMLDTYWPIFRRILNDPVMLRVNAYFDRNKYTAIKTFLQPLRVKTNQTNNLYYLNRITGYKSGHESCEGELIKL